MSIRATGSAARRLATAAATADEAELRRRVTARPNSVTDWQQLGILLLRTGRPGEATDAFTRAIAAGASALVLAAPRALALSEAGRAEEAVCVLAFARKKRPKDFALTNLLGVLLKRAGRLKEAIPVLEAAKRLDPCNIAPWQNLGNVFEALGRYRDAAAAFQGGLRAAPRDPELRRLHGRALRICGDLPAALASLERAITIAPGHHNVVGELISVLLDLGRPESAAVCVADARKANAADAAFHDVMEARIKMRQGDLELARGLLNKAIQTAPAEPDAYFNLARSFGDGDRASANEALRRGLACNPRSTPLAGELVESLSRSRYGDEAALLQEAYDVACRLLAGDNVTMSEHTKSLRTVFQRCLDFDRFDATGSLAELAPRWIAEGHIFALLHELGTVRSLEDRKRIVEWHREWGRQQSARIAPVEPLTMPALHTGRPIRVGFMSSDLRVHPVTIFARQLLDQYDRDRFEVYCYSFFEGERDRMQAHIEGRVAGFRWWPRRPDAEVAAGIALDGLDILFELGGTTAMNKLAVMAYHPARIGASWLGYPHSAGFEQIDYIVTDPYIRPEDPCLLIEQAFEMPETWVSLGHDFLGEPIEPGMPEERRGYVTFGTMNNPYKYNRGCLDVWAACLRAVPGSRFPFVRPEGRAPAFVANARAAFGTRDVDPDRLEFIGIRGDHLKHYNAIDIALDTFPHTGGTTTCETLWMGVPVVTMIGPGFPERLSYSILSNAGLGELAVRTVDDFVAAAACLAADRARRRELPQGLRGLIREHPLGQEDQFVRAFYHKIENVVRQ